MAAEARTCGHYSKHKNTPNAQRTRAIELEPVRTAAPLDVVAAVTDAAALEDVLPAAAVVVLPVDVDVALPNLLLPVDDPVEAADNLAKLMVVFLLIGMPAPRLILPNNVGFKVLVFAGAVRFISVAL